MSVTVEEALACFRPEIRSMQAYIPGEQPQHGSKVIKLNTNENPYPPAAQVIDAIKERASQQLERYPDPLGTSFRVRAAEVFGIPPDWFLCGNGSDDILTMVTRAFVGQGDLLRLPYPSYILYRTLAQLQGADYEEVRFRSDFSLADDFSKFDSRLKLAFLPNPNSPSGTALQPAQILQLANRLPCPLLVDEAYADFADSNCLDLVRQNPRIMVSRTLSKSYALAGLRFGFLVAQPPLIEMLRKVKDSYNCDALSIAGATVAIGQQDWLSANRRQIIATRNRMTQSLRGLGFTVQPSQANFVWCTRADRAVKPIYEQLKSEQILVRYMNYPGWGDGLRISVGSDEQIDACLALLEKILCP